MASGYQHVQLSHSTHSAGTSSGEAVSSNSDRRYLLLINDSDTDIYIKFGASAVVSEGIRIGSAGGSYEASPRNGNLDIRAVNAIHGGTGSKTLLVAEA